MKRSREAWAKFLATRFAGLFIDAAIIALAYFSAVLLRLDFQTPTSIGGWSSVALLYVNVCVVYLLALILTGCYRIPWRRTTAADLPRYLVATVLATVVLTAMRFYLPNVSLSHVRPPYSITAICFFLVTAGIFVVRLVWHVWWVSHVREEDLLERKIKNFDGSVARRFLEGKVVMVTGAGGSIGSELCRKIAAHHPKQLIIFDIYENSAYEIQQELLRKYPELVKAMSMRHIVYNEEKEYVFKKAEQNEVVVICPEKPLGISRTESNADELQRVYEEGRRAALNKLDSVKKFLEL